MKTYAGGCHCGKVRYQVRMDLQSVMTCNCSYCSKKGFILSFVPASQFKLLSGENNLAEYRFNKKVIQHLFCKACGVQSFGKGKGPDGSPTVMINVRCLDNVDYNKLPTKEFNGKDR